MTRQFVPVVLSPAGLVRGGASVKPSSEDETSC